MATFYVVDLCIELSFMDIILEGNVIQIVNAVKAQCKNWNKFGYIVDEIQIGLNQLKFWSIDKNDFFFILFFKL